MSVLCMHVRRKTDVTHTPHTDIHTHWKRRNTYTCMCPHTRTVFTHTHIRTHTHINEIFVIYVENTHTHDDVGLNVLRCQVDILATNNTHTVRCKHTLAHVEHGHTCQWEQESPPSPIQWPACTPGSLGWLRECTWLPAPPQPHLHGVSLTGFDHQPWGTFGRKKTWRWLVSACTAQEKLCNLTLVSD